MKEEDYYCVGSMGNFNIYRLKFKKWDIASKFFAITMCGLPMLMGILFAIALFPGGIILLILCSGMAWAAYEMIGSGNEEWKRKNRC